MAAIVNNDRYQSAHKYLSSFPPGYRFEPDDHELILFYLMPRINAGVQDLPINLMYEINIYSANPQDLTECCIPQGDTKWYFFTPRDRKYKNGSRPNRKAGDGYWKATGADKVIKYKGVEIGFRKALVFYMGNPPKGDKTHWIMHEFRVAGPPQANKRKRDDDTEDTSMRLDDSVLCRIYKNDGSQRSHNHHAKEDNVHVPFNDQVTQDDDDYDNQVLLPKTNMTSTNNSNNITNSNNTMNNLNIQVNTVNNNFVNRTVVDHDEMDYHYLMSSTSTSNYQPIPIRSVPCYENGCINSSWSPPLMLPPLASWENANIITEPPLSVNDYGVHSDDYSLGLIVNEHCFK